VPKIKTMKTGTFVSIWEEGSVRTPATLNEETGEVTTESVDVDGMEHLLEEWFEDEEGEEHDICSTCHEYLIKGNGVCMNPNCKE